VVVVPLMAPLVPVEEDENLRFLQGEQVAVGGSPFDFIACSVYWYEEHEFSFRS
jgi:hypothetical protein